MQTYREPARDLPVTRETDVIVVGGGPAGSCAAIAAARNGAQVVLIEQFGYLGGTATASLMACINTTTLLSTEPPSIRGHSERSKESLPALIQGRRGVLRGELRPKEILRSVRQEAGFAQNDLLLSRIFCGDKQLAPLGQRKVAL